MTKFFQDLKFYCASGKMFNKKALALLEGSSDLDLASEEGLVFKLAAKHSNPELLGALLKYYEEHKLQGDRESLEYKNALFTLRKIFDDLEHCYNLKEKGVDKVLKPYLSSEEDDKQDFASLDEIFVEDDSFRDDYNIDESRLAPEASDFCGWPEALSHQSHLSGENGNGITSPEVH